MKTVLLSLLALIAFAGNSVLCRLALASHSIDPIGFTLIRLMSGAIVLMCLMYVNRSVSRPKPLTQSRGSWTGGFFLFLYAALFSLAYVTLDTATGALVLFGFVQLAMILAGLFKHNRLSSLEWLGLALACFGLAYLLWPEVSKPSVTGFLMMALAGVAWAIYTIKGQSSVDPLSDTGYNFLRALPFIALLCLPFIQTLDITLPGALLAVVSGGLTSGVGYAVWYAALRGLSTTQAAVIQLLVPLIAAAGGILFAHEVLGERLLVSSIMVLGGIMMVILGKKNDET